MPILVLPEPTVVPTTEDEVNEAGRIARAEAADSRFHEIYDEGKTRKQAEVPLLVILVDRLVLFRNGARSEFSLVHHGYDLLKAVAHVPIGVYTLLVDEPDGALTDCTRGRLAEVGDGIERLLDSVEADVRLGSAGDVRAAATDVLRLAREYVRTVLSSAQTNAAALRDFAAHAGKGLNRCIELATGLQLDLLHACVTKLVHDLDPNERRAFQVVVTGDHQARVRCLAMQYFEKLLGEEPGSEKRLTYGEGIRTADEARTLFGTKRLDLVVAQAFFGDSRRLQRDVLGDAAKALLGRFDVGPL